MVVFPVWADRGRAKQHGGTDPNTEVRSYMVQYLPGVTVLAAYSYEYEYLYLVLFLLYNYTVYISNL